MYLIKKLSPKYTQTLKTSQENNPIKKKKWAKDFNRHLTKKDIQIANKHTKRSFISYGMKQVNIKPTMTYHYISIRAANIQIANKTKCWQ